MEETPFAAASIGQVHRAVLPDGQAVVVKVQYPNVDECCDSDLKQIRLALRLAGVLKIDRKLQDELFTEIQDSLHAELDYTQEAHNLQVFAAFHQAIDLQLIIPKVYTDYSSRRVLTLSEERGESIETAATWPIELRNTLGQRLFAMISQQIFYLNSFHCDPHPGNFAFRPDGAVVVYDFGCVKELPLAVVQSYRRLVKAAQNQHIDALETELRALRVRNDHGQVPAAFYQEWLELLMPPLNGEFNFGDSDLHHQTINTLKRSLKYWDSFQPSADTMMINRAVSGHYWNMVALKVAHNFKPLVERVIATP
jgi:predicted unusual protein kinase regulating ubiquinone biosynthesis (AarF/ABC1/UbiB family)